MAVQTYRPSLLSGQVYVKRRGTADPLRLVGNVAELKLDVTEEEKDLRDFTAPGGGLWASVSRVSKIDAAMKLHDLDPQNLALATYGALTAVPAGTSITESAVAARGGLIRLAHISPTGVVLAWGGAAWAGTSPRALGDLHVVTGKLYKVTTAGTTGASAPTWPASGTVTDGTVTWTYQGAWAPTVDVDYEVRPEGVLILEGVIEDGHPLSITYDHGAYTRVEALAAGSHEYELSFGGLNEAMSDAPVVVDIFRLKVSHAKSLNFVGSDFAALDLTGKVLQDPTKVGTGVSKYFRVSQV